MVTFVQTTINGIPILFDSNPGASGIAISWRFLMVSVVTIAAPSAPVTGSV